MAILRVNKRKGYFTASNEPFNDERLSWEARGVMGYLLSKPNGWQARNNDLERRGKAGRDKIARIIKELRNTGYISRYKYRGQDGRYCWITDVFESPTMNPEYMGEERPEETIPAFSVHGETGDGEAIHGQGVDYRNNDLTNKEITKEDITEQDEILLKGDGKESDPEPAFDTLRTVSGMSLENLWESTLRELKLQLTKSTFMAWLAKTELEEGKRMGGVIELTIAVKDKYAIDWLANRLNATIENNCKSVADEDVKIFYTTKEVQYADPEVKEMMEEITTKRNKSAMVKVEETGGNWGGLSY